MVSTSKAVILPAEQGVGQGDVFKDVKYSYIDSEDGDSVEVMELTFPYAIVVSQSCDVAYMDDFESGETSAAVKYMPSILMCPIYPKDLIKHGEHLKEVFSYLDRTIESGAPYYNKEDIKVAEKDQHVRFHALKIDVDDKTIVDQAVIDFKHPPLYSRQKELAVQRHACRRKSQRSDLQHCGNSKGKQPCAQRLYPVPFRESA